MTSAAASVTLTRCTAIGLEEAHWFGVVAHQQILCLLIVVEHHLMCFATDARLFVSAEGRVRWIEVVAIGPDASGLNGSARAIGEICIAGPDAGAQPIQGFVGKLQRLFFSLEGG